MLMRLSHALVPCGSIALRAAELPRQNRIERLHLFLSPAHTGAHHRRREARLEAADRVADDGEIHKRELPDVQVEVALEDALPAFSN